MPGIVILSLFQIIIRPSGIPLATAAARKPLSIINQNATSNIKNPVNVKAADILVKKSLSLSIQQHETSARRPLSVLNQNATANNNSVKTTDILVNKKSLSLSQVKPRGGKNPIDAHIAHAREISNKLLGSSSEGILKFCKQYSLL